MIIALYKSTFTITVTITITTDKMSAVTGQRDMVVGCSRQLTGRTEATRQTLFWYKV